MLHSSISENKHNRHNVHNVCVKELILAIVKKTKYDFFSSCQTYQTYEETYYTLLEDEIKQLLQLFYNESLRYQGMHPKRAQN